MVQLICGALITWVNVSPNMKIPSLKKLLAMPTLAIGQTDDLKIDEGSIRIWVSRLTVEDGMPYNHQLTIEHKREGVWETESVKKWR